MLSVTEQIRKTINDIPAGEIIMTSDFADISNLATIRKCLGRCVEDGLIRRVFDGVYEKLYKHIGGRGVQDLSKEIEE